VSPKGQSVTLRDLAGVLGKSMRRGTDRITPQVIVAIVVLVLVALNSGGGPVLGVFGKG